MADRNNGQNTELVDFLFTFLQKKVGIASAVIEVSCLLLFNSLLKNIQLLLRSCILMHEQEFPRARRKATSASMHNHYTQKSA